MKITKWIAGGILSLMWIDALGAEASADAEADSLWAYAIELDEVGFTGKKISNARRTMSTTPVYDRSEMQGTPVQNVEAALRLSPAVDVRERGAKGVQSDFMVRGGTFDQTMVSLNGINFTDARTGHQSHSLPIDLNSVASVSVVDGVCGVGAYAGAVDIRTAPRYDRYLSVEAMGGMHGYGYAALSGNIEAGPASVMGALSWRHSDGYMPNTNFTNYNAYANARINAAGAGLFVIQGGYQNRAFGANGFYSLQFPNQYEQTSTALGSVQWQLRLDRLTLSANASYRRNTDRFELIKGDESMVPFNYHITDNVGAEAAVSYDWGAPGETSVNADMMWHHIWSTVLGEACDPKVFHGIAYNHSKERSVINAVLRHSIEAGALSAAASVGVSHSDYGTDGLWSVNASYSLTPSWRIGAGAVESMRLPTFTDLYYTARGFVSNPNLKPEHATTVHINPSFGHGPWTAGVYLYYRHGRNIIDWIKPENDENWHSMQLTRINTLGAELTAAYVPNRFVKRVSVAYSHIWQNSKVDPGVISSFDFDHLRHKLVGEIEFQPFKRFTLSLTGLLFDRVGNYADNQGQVRPFSPYFLLDARAQYDLGWMTAYVDATNLTCTKYYDFGGLEMPGCWVIGGLAFTIK